LDKRPVGAVICRHCVTDQQAFGILRIMKPSTFRGWKAVKQVPSGFLPAHTCPFALYYLD